MKIIAGALVLLLAACSTVNEKKLDSNLAQLKEQNQQMKQEIRSLKATLEQLDASLKEEIAARNVAVQQVSPASIQVTMQQQLLFDVGSIAISRSGRRTLARVAEGLRKSPENSRIRIVGHTDSWPVGEKLRNRFTDNWELSAARAAAVARVLIWGEGIAEKRLRIEGLAHIQPVAENNTAEGRARNRRIEIFVETGE